MPNQLLAKSDHAEYVALFVTALEAEKARQAEVDRPPTLEEVKAAKRARIDAETSAVITAGFVHEVDGMAYRFSYDSFDQQNFADTANVCALKLQGVAGLPDTVTWNVYTIPEGELVRLSFDAPVFLALYTDGALAHKNRAYAEGKREESRNRGRNYC